MAGKAEKKAPKSVQFNGNGNESVKFQYAAYTTQHYTLTCMYMYMYVFAHAKRQFQFVNHFFYSQSNLLQRRGECIKQISNRRLFSSKYSYPCLQVSPRGSMFFSSLWICCVANAGYVCVCGYVYVYLQDN